MDENYLPHKITWFRLPEYVEKLYSNIEILQALVDALNNAGFLIGANNLSEVEDALASIVNLGFVDDSTFNNANSTTFPSTLSVQEYITNLLLGKISSIVAGTNVSIDITDPLNPIINVNSLVPPKLVLSVTGDLVDNTDPENPIILTPPQTDIYSADGIISAERLVSLGSNNLKFEGSGLPLLTMFGVTGSVGIGTAAPQAKLEILAQGALSTDIVQRIRNNTDTANLFEVRGNGEMIVNGKLTTNTAEVQIGDIGADTGSFRIDGVNGGDFAFSVYSSNVLRFGVTGFGGVTTNGASIDTGVGPIISRSARFGAVGGNATIDLQAQPDVNLVSFKISNGSLAFLINPLGNVIMGGGSDVPSAKLQVKSTTQGFLPPLMTTTQKNAIATPATGLQVYDTTLNQMSYYNGSIWVNI